MILIHARHLGRLYNEFCSNTCLDETEWCKRSSLSGSGQHRTFVTGDNNNQPQHNHSPASGTSHFRKLTRSLKSSERSWGSLWGKCRIARFGGGSHSITHLRLCLHVSQECRIIASCIRAGAAFLTFFQHLHFHLITLRRLHRECSVKVLAILAIRSPGRRYYATIQNDGFG